MAGPFSTLITLLGTDELYTIDQLNSLFTDLENELLSILTVDNILLQEDLDMNGQTIKNVATGTENGDAVTLGQLREAALSNV